MFEPGPAMQGRSVRPPPYDAHMHKYLFFCLATLLGSLGACSSSSSNPTGGGDGGPGGGGAGNCAARCNAIADQCHGKASDCDLLCTALTEGELACLERASCD